MKLWGFLINLFFEFSTAEYAMKKFFISVLAVLGILSVIVGPIDVHAQSTEIGSILASSEEVDIDTQSIGIEPMCQPAQGNHVVQTRRQTRLFSSAVASTSNVTVTSGLNFTVVGSLTPTNGRLNVRRNVGGVNMSGWITRVDVVFVTC